MLIYGYGDHGKVVADCLLQAHTSIEGIFDDEPDFSSTSCPFPFLGEYDPSLFPGEAILLAIGDNRTRKKLAQKLRHSPGILQHSSAIRSSRSHLGPGTMVLQRAVLQTGSIIGQHCIVNTGAIVEHDCHLDDFVHLASGAVLSGRVRVGEGSLIGAAAVVLPGIRIGKYCMVGAGAVVTKDVEDGGRVVGNPARVING